jgi:hypothetical protein
MQPYRPHPNSGAGKMVMLLILSFKAETMESSNASGTVAATAQMAGSEQLL